jgi:hypothetical protein
MNLYHLIVYSPVIVGFLLIFVYIILRQRYRIPFGAFFRYIFFGGAIFFVCTFIYLMTLISGHSPQGPLTIPIYGPLAFSLGELAGFALFL